VYPTKGFEYVELGVLLLNDPAPVDKLMVLIVGPTAAAAVIVTDPAPLVIEIPEPAVSVATL
jgi:hypothetical protein